jgi:hypothetical protein
MPRSDLASTNQILGALIQIPGNSQIDLEVSIQIKIASFVTHFQASSDQM